MDHRSFAEKFLALISLKELTLCVILGLLTGILLILYDQWLPLSQIDAWMQAQVALWGIGKTLLLVIALSMGGALLLTCMARVLIVMGLPRKWLMGVNAVGMAVIIFVCAWIGSHLGRFVLFQ